MSDLESLAGPIPGPRTKELLASLRAHESRNVTYMADDFPVFWDSAHGATVVDVDGNRYIDLTAAFGVANAGHSNAQVVSAVAAQAARVMHAMGDIHPSLTKAQLLERLPEILPPGLTKTFLTSTGAEAVEAAMKTAMLATGRSSFIAFRGAYHGLSFGTLAVGGIEKFRTPFAHALAHRTTFVDYPRIGVHGSAEAALTQISDALRGSHDVAAVIIEPIQGRGGNHVPPPGFLAALHHLCAQRGVLLVLDEIYTGYGRTGAWFAALTEQVVPDVICIGKAMGNGFPIGATVAKPEIMDAWPVSRGEALHTSTYLGNPMACAAALATIDEHQRLQLAQRAHQLGHTLARRLDALGTHAVAGPARGRGLMWGIELDNAQAAEAVVKRALARGVMVLQAGLEGEVIALTPPLVITEAQLVRALDILEEEIARV